MSDDLMPPVPKGGSANETEMCERWGGWIRQRRKTLGLTQEQLGRLTGTSCHDIGRFENGRSYPNVDHPQGLKNLFALKKELEPKE